VIAIEFNMRKVGGVANWVSGAVGDEAAIWAIC
jgi:hypothetical protein